MGHVNHPPPAPNSAPSPPSSERICSRENRMHAPKKTIRIGDDDRDDLDAAVKREARKATVSFNLGDLLGEELNEQIEDIKDAFKDAKEDYKESAKGVGRDIKDGLTKFGEQLKKAVEEAAAEEQRRLDLEKGMSREVALAWGVVVGALVTWFLVANWDAIVNVFTPRRGRNFAYENLDGGGRGRSGGAPGGGSAGAGASLGDANANASDPHRAQLEAEMRARQAARAAAAEAAAAERKKTAQAAAEVAAAAATTAGGASSSAAAATATATAVGLTQPRTRPNAAAAAEAAANAREAARRAFLERQQTLMDAASKRAQEKKSVGAE